jgi:hypothetical protein
MSQMIELFITTAVGTSNLTSFRNVNWIQQAHNMVLWLDILMTVVIVKPTEYILLNG